MVGQPRHSLPLTEGRQVYELKTISQKTEKANTKHKKGGTSNIQRTTQLTGDYKLKNSYCSIVITLDSYCRICHNYATTFYLLQYA